MIIDNIELTTGIQTKVSTILEFPFPSWSNSDCPYCSLGYQNVKRLPRLYSHSYTPRPGVTISCDLDLIVWLLTEIYSSRASMLKVLEDISSMDRFDESILYDVSRILIIHGQMAQKWCLISEAVKLIEKCFNIVDVHRKCSLFSLIPLVTKPIQHLIFTKFIKNLIPAIDDENVFLSVFEVLRQNNDWIYHANDIVEQQKHILSATKLNKWSLIRTEAKSQDMVAFVTLFLAFTKINRSKATHERLNDVIKKEGIQSFSVKSRLRLLKRLVKYFPESDNFEKFKYYIDNPSELVEALEDETYTNDLTSEIAINAMELMIKVAKSVGDPQYRSEMLDVMRKTPENRIETPLICAHLIQLEELIKHLESNLDKGPSKVKAKILGYETDQPTIHIDCTTEIDIVDNIIETANKSESLRQLNLILSNSGMNVKYTNIAGKFVTRIIGRVVDHVQVKDSDM